MHYTHSMNLSTIGFICLLSLTFFAKHWSALTSLVSPVVNHTGIENDTKDTLPFILQCKPFLSVEVLGIVPGNDVDGDGDEDWGAILIQAEDFLLEPHEENVQYSINTIGEPLDSVRSTYILTCDDRPAGELQLRAWDQAGNYSACTLPFGLTDTREYCGHCHPLVKLIGWIRTENGVGVPAVGITNGHNSRDNVTWLDGYYDLCGTDGEDKVISFFKTGDYLEGVSISDLVKIRAHVLALDSLDSPYKLLAADVNNDGRVSTFDILELHQLLLGLQTSFRNNDSWRFVDEEYVFSDPNNPWLEVFPTTHNFSMSTYGDQGNFIAIKVGDVDGTAPLSPQ